MFEIQKVNDLHWEFKQAAELRKWINDGQTWLFVFGRSMSAYIDDLDDMIGIYPTCPTVMGIYPITFVPKAKLSRARIHRWMADKGVLPEYLTEDQGDIFCVVGPDDDAIQMLAYVGRLATQQ